MSGIYLHIPFCHRKCGYCNFYSIAGVRQADDLVQALVRELTWRKDALPDKKIETVYWGGGTPSLLGLAQLETIINAVNRHYSLGQDPEITLECNPDDLSPDKLHGWKNLGINRLSIGLQSFHADDLAYLDRRHQPREALLATEKANAAGFNHLSIDLIFGIPGQDMKRWEDNLRQAVALNVEHISTYALTVEDRTLLHRQITTGLKSAPDEDETASHFLLMHQLLTTAGYEHYEISNFARPGAYARHNTSYWQGVPYLGFGPSAHSFDGKRRWWNHAHLGSYIAASNPEEMKEGEEELGQEERYNEYVMTGLRTMWGCEMAKLESLGPMKQYQHFELQASEYQKQGWMIRTGNTWKLTAQGMLRADGLAASFFI